MAAVEDAWAWQNRFRIVALLPAAAVAMAIAAALLRVGGRF